MENRVFLEKEILECEKQVTHHWNRLQSLKSLLLEIGKSTRGLGGSNPPVDKDEK